MASVAVSTCEQCTHNLSCPRTDPDTETLQCISTSQLCDGTELCSGGQDEGDNIAALDCKQYNSILHLELPLESSHGLLV